MSGANAAGKRKPLDPRIPTLIQNSLHTNHRSLFLLLGDLQKSHSQIVNLHFLLSQSIASLPNPTPEQIKNPRPRVLWCYKKDLGFETNRRKKEGRRKAKKEKGTVGEDMSPFELFTSVTDIRYTYYKDTESILGQTFQMLILQDFHALTPNLLARTIETVAGGGIVVCLLSGMNTLRGLYQMTMDAHSRYRSTSSPHSPVARFNERFLLSLGTNPSCLVLDDELNILPISAGKDITPLPGTASFGVARSSAGQGKSKEEPAEARELRTLLESMKDTPGIGHVLQESKTLDQAKAILQMTDLITSKSLSQTLSLTAGRGRGKSASLGLAIALALLNGYSNIFLTSPTPSNLQTLFQFLFKGLDRLGWEEHLDYEIITSTRAEWEGMVVRVNVFRGHRQTVQYIQPSDAHVLGQAELVIIDEAAAIPLPLVKGLLGPYLVFMASTINGYEGTGRSLSLKLIKSLREQSATSNSKEAGKETGSLLKSRSLFELSLNVPIRYSSSDPIEAWLNGLLCLDATVSSKTLKGCPHPSTCDLYSVSRDTLFSYHPASELFLQRMMSLMVASHYKNSPNDLMLMSDAPNQELFVLLAPVEGEGVPEPLAVVQIALEGKISKASVLENISRGKMADGDLIPWTISSQFQDDDFASLSGARVVRIAVHPDYTSMGYGARALELLTDFYSRELLNLTEVPDAGEIETFEQAAKKQSKNAQTEQIAIRDPSKMPPLLQKLSEVQPPALDYMGVSYGVTPQLFKFWKKNKYVPLYVRQTANDLTGEHTCVMVRGLKHNEEQVTKWLAEFSVDFRKRFITLLSYKFREFASITGLSILEASTSGASGKSLPHMTTADVRRQFSPFDMKRLESYSNNMLDYHVILDMLPALASLYFQHRFPEDVKLSGVQSSILLALGLQRRSVEDVEKELGLPVSQILALFVKTLRKMSKSLQETLKNEISASIPEENNEESLPKLDRQLGNKAGKTIVEELAKEGEQVLDEIKKAQQDAINSLDLKAYAITANSTDWTSAEERVSKGNAGGIISIKNADSTKGKRRRDEDGKDKSGKKKKGKK